VAAEPIGGAPAKLQGSLRGQALVWLWDDLTSWARLLGDSKARSAAHQALTHWQQDPDLAGVRDPAALAQLPGAERAQWQKLWADVAALRAKLGDAK
jgi:hypothetical protein